MSSGMPHTNMLPSSTSKLAMKQMYLIGSGACKKPTTASKLLKKKTKICFTKGLKKWRCRPLQTIQLLLFASLLGKNCRNMLLFKSIRRDHVKIKTLTELLQLDPYPKIE
jgi:hypothetical protein